MMFVPPAIDRDNIARKGTYIPGQLKSPLSLANLHTANPGPLRWSGPSGKGKHLPSRHSDSSLLRFQDTDGRKACCAQQDAACHRLFKSGSKQWLHPSEDLINSEIICNVKFLGECAVDQPEGTEVVKSAIRKMKFNTDLKRAEGDRPAKVHLFISIFGLRIEHPKNKGVLYEYPLHRISYCADDKSDKKMFAFIAKAASGPQHYCYVFHCNEESAEEITLTVGQAFDLAYRRFLEDKPAINTDYRKHWLLLHSQVNSLQRENMALKKRLAELEAVKDHAHLQEYMKNNQLTSLTSVTFTLGDSSDQESGQQTPDYCESPQPPRSGLRERNELWRCDVTQNSNSKTAPSWSNPAVIPSPPCSGHLRRRVTGIAMPIRQHSLPTTLQSQGDYRPDPFGMGTFQPGSSSPAPPCTCNGARAPLRDGVEMPVSAQLEHHDCQSCFSRGLYRGTQEVNQDNTTLPSAPKTVKQRCSDECRA